MSDREERMARNETTARQINEDIEDAQPSSGPGLLRIVCECGDLDCSRVIAISAPEYESVRADPTHFAVVKGHEVPAIEDVIGGTDRYTVVRKRPGVPAEIVEEEDPRS